LDNFAIEDPASEGVLALDADATLNYDELTAALDTTLTNTAERLGDANQDNVIDERDLDAGAYCASTTSGESSRYDIDLDGATDE